ncbi:hypothetical protein AAIB41_05645 [Brucella sp. BE17]|uniref:hypothetical protein n=1 Tax=Brucella sp. BE17 TaxID=3142977 RepID=UPI0031BA5113
MNKARVTYKSQIVLAAVAIFGLPVAGAYAADVTNQDSVAQTIVVTEGASKREMIVAPNETVDFCSSGCFVTFPNGDRQALTGEETITISGGKASIK